MTPADVSAWLALAPLVMQLVEYIVSTIERLYPNGAGIEKKAIALKLVRATVPKLETGVSVPESWLSKLIDNQVALDNQAGIFVHSHASSRDQEPVGLYGV